MPTFLLGPQRFLTTAGTVVRSVAPEGPVATVTAGWQDRETADEELHEVMDGRSRNLQLYRRLTEVIETDDHFAREALAHRDAMDELAGIYSVRLQRALESAYVVARRPTREDIAESAFADAIRGVRDIDAWYLRSVDQLYGELQAAAPPEASEPIARNRAEVAELLRDATVLAIAGGHVGILLRCLRLFEAVPREVPVVAWSAGAMAMTDRVVLYNDNGPQGVRGAEVWDRGAARVHDVVAMPHARRRLKLDDPVHAKAFVRRFAPAACLLLDDGTQVEISADGRVPDDARVLTETGAREGAA
ncbi:Type 1 glutamine amidotransferase-like domain-containing protein [Nocardioides agariphilus]|uniref:Type 1 glutamine amidotransferase-like domain-containing protein n=1 Tax=Nocardioides agariphilus TaxID=433664 RepID=A0A930VP87_9ACTN|nr:Type 1 glutamine amidotransferase-like domain-containing protein [Nocardioides agariphilus]